MEIKFKWIGAATFILQVNSIKIACDPVLCKKGTIQNYTWFKSKRIEDPVYKEVDFDEIDLWFLTHAHEDHLDKFGAEKVKKESHIISEKKAAKKLLKTGIEYPLLQTMDWGERIKINLKDCIITIKAIPAIHGRRSYSSFFAGKVNGYFVELQFPNESFSIYITGDTVLKNNVVEALKKEYISLMIPNLGAVKKNTWMDLLTMDMDMMLAMNEILEPEYIIPVHYNTFSHYVEKKEAIVTKSPDNMVISDLGVETGLSYSCKI